MCLFLISQIPSTLSTILLLPHTVYDHIRTTSIVVRSKPSNMKVTNSHKLELKNKRSLTIPVNKYFIVLNTRSNNPSPKLPPHLYVHINLSFTNQKPQQFVSSQHLLHQTHAFYSSCYPISASSDYFLSVYQSLLHRLAYLLNSINSEEVN